MDATKGSTGEPTSPNPIQSVVEFVRKNKESFKNLHGFGDGLSKTC